MKRPFGVISGLFARPAGYAALAERFGVPLQPPGSAQTRQTVMMDRTVAYKWCVTLAPIAEGLYMRVDARGFRQQPAVLIPWEQVAAVEPARLYWAPAVKITVGVPRIASLTVYAGLYESFRPYLNTRVISQQ